MEGHHRGDFVLAHSAGPIAEAGGHPICRPIGFSISLFGAPFESFGCGDVGNALAASGLTMTSLPGADSTHSRCVSVTPATDLVNETSVAVADVSTA